MSSIFFLTQCPSVYLLAVSRIDENVLGAQLDVEAAHSEILKYFQSVTSNRWLMVKIFLILIVFFIIFVVFLA
jgi:syntaxin 5